MISARTPPRRHHRGLACAAAAIAAALAGCGGAGATTTGPAGGTELAAISSASISSPAPARRLGAAVRTGQLSSRARFPGGADSEEGPTGAKPIKPCALVTKAEAAAIVRRPMAKVWEAPQGPTCIYQARGDKRYITLAVQSMVFSKAKRHMRVLARHTVRGRTAYCVDFGRVTTFVPVSASRVLNVTAPCSVATRFAAKALPRLHL